MEQKKEKKPKRNKMCDPGGMQKSRERYFSKSRSKVRGWYPSDQTEGPLGSQQGMLGVCVIPTTKTFITIYEPLLKGLKL